MAFLVIVSIWFIYLTFILNNIDTTPIDNYFEINNISLVDKKLSELESNSQTRTFIFGVFFSIKLYFLVKSLS